MSRRSVCWTRSLGQPFSKGGSPICDKHDFIEANSADPEMAYEIAEAARAALKDGQNMESALKERKKDIEGMQSETDWANEQIEAMQARARRLRISQLRRMIQATVAAEARSLKNFRICWTARSPLYSVRERAIVSRLDRFRAACLAEIVRLRGEG